MTTTDSVQVLTIRVNVLLFASAREAAGNISQVEVELKTNENCDTVGIRSKLASLYPKLKPSLLDEESITLALNEEYIPSGAIIALKDGDTIALIPPISGG
jgi:molybdopterin converting factor small subunit